MKSPHRRGSDLRTLCAELHEDDGIDPRAAFARGERSHRKKEHHKARQLCKQAQRSLASALQTDCGDPHLHDVEITAVEPAPDCTRLRVVVRNSATEAEVTGEELLARLVAAGGVLRGRLARDIARKRVPELTFALAAQTAGPIAGGARQAVVACEGSAEPAPPLEHKSPLHMWLCDPLPVDVRLAVERIARDDDVRHVAVMPDVHLAAGVCVGNVIATSRLIYPQAIGGDIGCGMAAIAFDCGADALARESIAREMLDGLRAAVPALRHRSRHAAPELPAELRGTDSAAPRLTSEALVTTATREGRVELGTLGRGNHFLEFQADDEGRLWLMIHSGSRCIGQAIHALHIRRAERSAGGLFHLDADSAAGQAYLQDMEWACRYADANRRCMIVAAAELLRRTTGAQSIAESLFTCDHNHVRRESHRRDVISASPAAGPGLLYVHRKGAISARDGEPGIIPGSMGTLSFHVVGRGAARALCSSSHGAGRRFSRETARRRVAERDLLSQMRDVWFDERLARRLCEEAPAAYKDIEAVFRAQRELTRVIRRLRPVLVYKGV